ncbi:hypothetical protein B0A48_10952 [Cryoendolithus antarcticus]|uniref:Uncharacterized protein n=1 Tax=Cryoendolithus antarcticus TaxID=1507870 RepID=A0A1V8SZ94_9PEZI|nr:hypothetical protein B0A48_10952 [Cryoendolithus antarcticus]
MAIPGPRLGLEVEFHALKVIWRRHDDATFFPETAAGRADIPVRSFNVAQNRSVDAPIMVPVDQRGYGTEDNVTWEGRFGMHCVPDALGRTNVYLPDGTLLPAVNCCILEKQANTSAQPIADYGFWIQLHLCTRAFRAATLRFVDTSPERSPTMLRPLADFVVEYNAKVDEVRLPPGVVNTLDLFKLKLSDKVTSLADGSDPRFKPVRWDPLFIIARNEDQDLCHVNYQVDLGWLGSNVDSYTRLWWHTWAYRFDSGQPRLDPPVNTISKVGVSEVYRSMQYAALWQVARKYAAQLVTEEKDAALSAAAESQIIGLTTYLLAVGSLRPTTSMGMTPKNTYPQLPKTSPAALARAIDAQDASGAAGRTLMDLSTAVVAARAEQLMQVHVRNMFNLTTQGSLRITRPQLAWPGQEAYPHATGRKNIFSNGPPANFAALWRRALNVNDNTGYDLAHSFGFCEGAPFYVSWSSDVRTAVPPTSGVPASPPRLAFESRYASSTLNVGFSPSSATYMLVKSYLPLVMALAPEQWDAASAAVSALGNQPDVALNLDAGWH